MSLLLYKRLHIWLGAVSLLHQGDVDKNAVPYLGLHCLILIDH